MTIPATVLSYKESIQTKGEREKEVVVSVKNVSKKFCKKLKRSMAYGIVELAKNLVGMRPDSTELRKDEFWAIDDISFELRRGETLGLIGVNGSGKTTLMRLLAGLFPPDKGEIMIKGRVGALISLGAGFHPHMTGQENIYLNGTILGMNREEIDAKFQDIVDFAEIGDFLDSPVSTYSSGMRVRLGFGIAAHIEPDVMLIDEVLAVGDVGFRTKCLNAIARISQNAATILVSHAMPQVARACTRIMVMNNAKATYMDYDVPKGIEHYYSQFKGEKGVITGSGRATIHKIEFESNGKKDVQQINYLDDLYVHLYITVDPKVKYPIVFIDFLNRELQAIAQCSSLHNRTKIYNNGKPLHIMVKFPAVNFNPAVYLLSVAILDEIQREVLVYHYAIKELRLIGEFTSFAPVQLVGKWHVKR